MCLHAHREALKWVIVNAFNGFPAVTSRKSVVKAKPLMTSETCSGNCSWAAGHLCSNSNTFKQQTCTNINTIIRYQELRLSSFIYGPFDFVILLLLHFSKIWGMHWNVVLNVCVMVFVDCTEWEQNAPHAREQTSFLSRELKLPFFSVWQYELFHLERSNNSDFSQALSALAHTVMRRGLIRQSENTCVGGPWPFRGFSSQTV